MALLSVGAHEFWPLLIITGTAAILCSIMLLIIGTQFICGFDLCLTNINIRNPIKPVQYLSIFSLLSFITCLATQIYIIKSLRKDLNIPDYDWRQDVITSINTLSYAIGQVLIYAIFVVNLHHTFKHTILAMSKTMSMFLFILITMFLILRISFATQFLLFYNFIITQAHFSFVILFIVSTTEVIDLIVSIVLVYMFVNRLFKLFVLSQQNKKSHVGAYDYNISVGSSTKDSWLIQAQASITDETGYEETVVLNDKQQQILMTASKYAILSSIAIISTQLFLISGVNHAIAVNGSQIYYGISFRIWTLFGSLACFINSLCIFLNFQSNELLFSQICCLCDGCCYSICKCISKKYYKTNEQSLK